MEELTATGNTIVSVSPENIQLDRQVKKSWPTNPFLQLFSKRLLQDDFIPVGYRVYFKIYRPEKV